MEQLGLMWYIEEIENNIYKLNKNKTCEELSDLMVSMWEELSQQEKDLYIQKAVEELKLYN